MRGFLKYFILMILLVMALWTHETTAELSITEPNSIVRGIKSTKQSFSSIKRELVSLTNVSSFIGALPVE